MASAVAMMIGGAVEKLKMLNKKEKDMIEQSNSWKQLKQPGVKRECKDWSLLMSECKKNITQSRLLMM